ncbi:hypothetical protein EHQ71_18100 [Leptospira levettii]|nr:hypothetical protein EHQ71_18100 [Leptospira levettii]
MQLEIIKDFFEQNNINDFLKKKFNTIANIRKIHYVILSNSRLFSYAKFASFPIRSMYEFVNIVLMNKIKIANYEYLLYSGGKTKIEILDEYLSENFIVDIASQKSREFFFNDFNFGTSKFREINIKYNPYQEAKIVSSYLKKNNFSRTKLF